jgi:uncharacterized protein involved in tolerance to divalent cations
MRCESWQQAQRITDHLLITKLASSVETLASNQSPVGLMIKCLACNQLLICAELASQFCIESDTIYRLPAEHGSERILSWVDIHAGTTPMSENTNMVASISLTTVKDHS